MGASLLARVLLPFQASTDSKCDRLLLAELGDAIMRSRPLCFWQHHCHNSLMMVHMYRADRIPCMADP